MMLYNKLLEGVLLPMGDLLNKSDFVKELSYWRKIQNLSEPELVQLQQDKLKALLEHASANIPYYSKGFESNGESPQQWLQRFPVIRKKDIKKDINQFVSPNHKKLITYESSGSSGIQGKVYMDEHEQSAVRAILILWWEWAGYKMGHSLVQTGITPVRGFLKSVKDFLLRTHYFPAFNLNEEIILGQLRSVEKDNRRHLAGFASSLYLMAQVAEKHKMKIEFESTISWGDKMFPHYRTVIERAFKTKVFDLYACNEGFMIAAQKDLTYYYQMSPHTYLELLSDDGEPVPDGTIGHVVVTRLDGYSMPLIRYYTGDLAVRLPRDQYPATRELNFPLLEKIIGRDTDIVKTRSGKFMIVHFFTGLFEFYPSIRQFRVIQSTLDGIEVEYIKEPEFDPAVLTEVNQKIQEYLQEPFAVSFTEVPAIPASPSGKPQIISVKIG